MAQSNLKAGQRAHWSSSFVFVLAAAGSAVGLGNIWKFPYMAGLNGGGAFVLIYLGFIFAVGIPIFLAELYIGRSAQSNTVKAFEVLGTHGTPWRVVGLMGALSSFLILSFYSVVGGWVLNFVYLSATDSFHQLSTPEIQELLGGLFANYPLQIFWHAIFSLLVIGIVIGGVTDGLERWNKILMPMLLGLLTLLLIQSFYLSGFPKAIDFLFAPDFGKVTPKGILEAVGHAFFTLSLGMGCMITYGSYLNEGDHLPAMALSVAAVDTFIALASGIVIFAVVFTFEGTSPGAGPTLMFKTLPVLFKELTGGYFIALGFFTLVAVAALTSAISLLEVVVAYGTESVGMSRRYCTLLSGGVIFVLGLLSALSTNVLSSFTFFGMTFFDMFDQLSSSVLMPLGGLLIAVFYGWVLGPQAVAATLERKETSLPVQGLLWSARVIVPIAIAVVFVYKIYSWVNPG